MSADYQQRKKRLAVTEEGRRFSPDELQKLIGPQPEAPIEVIAFGPDGFEEKTVRTAAAAKEFTKHWPLTWINLDTSPNPNVVKDFAEIFALHELAAEDVFHGQQRVKVDDYGQHLFIVLRMISEVESQCTEQLSLFVGSDFVISFQESPGDCLSSVRERIRRDAGRIRRSGSDYLTYAIIDACVDGYFPVLEKLGDHIDLLEDEILDTSHKFTPAMIHELKRELLLLRRAVWPLRELASTLSRDKLHLISDDTRIYLRDCLDHSVRLIDLVETYRELVHDLMDMYLSRVNNRMNEIMKVMTIITTLFIPPTFIAGVYGMNFNPKSGPFNMPELEWPFGYFFSLGLMLVLVVGLTIYLYRRGWLFDKQ